MNASTIQVEHLLFLILLQLIVMIGAARYMHTVFRRLGQPRVHDAGDHGRTHDNDGGLAAELLSKTGHAIPVGLES